MKWMGVIGTDMRACGVDENMVRDKKGWRERMRIHLSPTACDGGEDKEDVR